MISFHDESYFYNKRRNFRLRLGCCEVTVLSGGVICRTEFEEIQEEDYFLGLIPSQGLPVNISHRCKAGIMSQVIWKNIGLKLRKGTTSDPQLGHSMAG